MGSRTEMTRKEFLTLTFTLIGTTAAVAGACDDDDSSSLTGTGGTSGTGTGGTTGTAGTTGTGGTTGTAGTTGTGGAPAAVCMNPLPAAQVPDSTMHTHTMAVPSSTLDLTTAQTFTTSVAAGHTHMVTLQPSMLATMKGGGSIMVTSSTDDLHAHVFMVSCQ